MKHKIKLSICALLYIIYRVAYILIYKDSIQMFNLELTSTIVCGLSLLAFVFVGKNKKLIASIPLIMYIIASLITISFEGKINEARFMDYINHNSGVFYILNYICEIILLNIVFGLIIFDYNTGNRYKISIFIVLIIISIVAMATSFYHVPIDNNLGEVAFKLLLYYVPLFIYMKTVLIDYKKLN